jgi:pyruvate/2-oxoglutarate dehydrogenase complex dihydrolipoamide dehydrogenase (E3) component
MRALTDNIIDMMIVYKQGNLSDEVRSSVEELIDKVKELEQKAKFEEVARVLIKHLNNPELYHPHYAVIVTGTHAELLEGKQGLYS